jgi:hypothetical protein
MARDPIPELIFRDGCPDCGERVVALPPPLPVIPDDFDWRARDYDSFRLFLMEELAHRFPERRRWTPADMEVVIVELLAAALDRMSHALDAIHAERFLETARRPGSVRRLLSLIGYDPTPDIDPAKLAALTAPVGTPNPGAWKVERLWELDPAEMEAARLRGPRRIHAQKRMVTLADHETRVVTHPLVTRARARLVWTGAWSTILVSVLLSDGLKLDDPLTVLNLERRQAIVDYHRQQSLPAPVFNAAATARRLLRMLVEQERLAGSEVFLEDAREAPIDFALSVTARPGHFRSQLQAALIQAFSADEGGFFAPGRFGFGEAVFASDIIQAAMGVEGVAIACLNRLKRAGASFPNRADAGSVAIAADELAVCFNTPGRGTFRINVEGGLVG